MRTEILHGHTVLFVDPDGPTIATPAGGNDLIGDAWSVGATHIAVPAERLAPEFFTLSSGLAGEILQKVVNYRLHIAVLGDIAAHLAASNALRDFVWESNRGEQVWFLNDEAALEAKLAERPA